jgi:putative addiction module killer protein
MIAIHESEIFKQWIRSLKNKITRSIINARIKRLSVGNFGDVKPVGESVSELRIDYGCGYRVYFSKISAEIVVLLCGGDKSTQSKDIEMAKKLAKGLES